MGSVAHIKLECFILQTVLNILSTGVYYIYIHNIPNMPSVPAISSIICTQVGMPAAIHFTVTSYPDPRPHPPSKNVSSLRTKLWPQKLMMKMITLQGCPEVIARQSLLNALLPCFDWWVVTPLISYNQLGQYVTATPTCNLVNNGLAKWCNVFSAHARISA